MGSHDYLDMIGRQKASPLMLLTVASVVPSQAHACLLGKGNDDKKW